MAITTMTNKERAGQPNVVRVDDYHGHEVDRASHAYDCTNRDSYGLTPSCPAGCRYHEPLYLETTHHGLVVELRENNGRDDSDFYAVVWNPTEQKLESVLYASTRGWTYPNHAEVDATAEVLAAVEAHRIAQAEAAQARRQEREATIPRKGCRVRVVSGRKVEAGTEATVFWFGRDKFYNGPFGRSTCMLDELDGVQLGAFRIGVLLDNGEKAFVNAKAVEVVPAA